MRLESIELLTFLTTTPLGLWIVGRCVLVGHGSLDTIVDCSTTIDRGIAIDTTTTLVFLVCCLVLNFFDVVLVDGYLSAYGTQLDSCLFIISISHSTAMALVLSMDDNDNFPC